MKQKSKLVFLALLLTSCSQVESESNSGPIASQDTVSSDMVESSSLKEESSSVVNESSSLKEESSSAVNESSSLKEESSSENSNQEENKTILSQMFNGYKEDSMPLYISGWYAANCKFEENCLTLIEGNDHSYGGGLVRTPSIECSSKIKVDVTCQVSNFNTNAHPTYLLDLPFSFEVSILNKEGEILESKSFSHTITEEDLQQEYISGMKPYTNNINDVATLSFDFESNEIDKVKVTYTEKLKYTYDGQNIGCNLQIFSLNIQEVQ